MYDGHGQRVRKTLSDGTEYYYPNKLFERRKDGMTTKDSIYIWLNGMCIAVQESNQDQTEASLRFYHRDHLGSTSLVTDEAGELIEQISYFPYGEICRDSAPDISRHKCTGKEFDPHTGLYNYGARLYDPGIGRFISVDPIIQNVYDPQALNPYTYCRSNPVNYIDPDGHLVILDDALFWCIGRIAGLRDDSFIEGTLQNFVESWCLLIGTFDTFENNETAEDWLEDIGELIGRLNALGGAINESSGLVLGYFAIELFGGVTERWEDVQLVKVGDSWPSDGRSFTFSSKVIGPRSSLDSPNLREREFTRAHEQGHYYQSLILGPFAIPVFLSNPSSSSGKNDCSYYNNNELEAWANELSGARCIMRNGVREKFRLGTTNADIALLYFYLYLSDRT